MDTIKASKAKKASLKAMTISAFWIGLHIVAKGVLAAFNLEYLSTYDILLSGIFMGGVYSPVYVSIFLDKLKELKQIGTGGQN